MPKNFINAHMMNKKILIVDDEPENLQTIADLLKDSDSSYEIMKAPNGNIALKLISKKIPDLIISDWEMPVMSGIEFIKKLRKNHPPLDIPVIMCTGVMLTSENLQTALKAGATDYIRKPVDKIELTARINSILKLSESQQIIKKQMLSLQEKTQEQNILNKNLYEKNLEIDQQNTELEQQKEELRAQTDELNEKQKILGQLDSNKAALLSIIDNSLKNELTLNEFLQKALDSILNVSWLSIKSQGAIFIKNEDGDLEMLAKKNIGNHRIKHCSIVKSGECICGKAIVEKKSYIGDYRSKFEKKADDIPYIHMKKPIMIGKEVYGLLNLYLEKDKGISETNIDFFETVCNSLANIILQKQTREVLQKQKNKQERLNKKLLSQNTELEQQKEELRAQTDELNRKQDILKKQKDKQERLNKKLLSQNTELEQQKEELHAQTEKIEEQYKHIKLSEEKYRILTETMKDVVITISPEGRIIYISPAITEFGGHIPEDEIGNHISKYLISKFEIENAKKIFSKVLTNHKSGYLNFTYKAKNKKPFPVELTYKPQVTNNKVKAIHLVLRDVSNQKKAEQIIKQKEHRLNTIIQNMGEGFGITDFNENFVFSNAKACEIFNVAEGELIGKSLQDFLDDSEWNRIKQESKNRKQNISNTYDLNIQLKDHSSTLPDAKIKKTIIVSTAPDYSKSGEIVGTLATFIDITERIKERKQLEIINLQLNESKEKYRAILTNLDDIFYRTNRKHNISLISPSALKYTNKKTVDDLIGLNIPQTFYYKPSDRLKLLQSLKKNNGKVTNYEILLKNKDNIAIPFETNSHFVYDEDGNITGVEGILRNISEQKKAALAIKLSEEKYRTLFEKSQNATLILKQGQFIAFNKAAKILFEITDKLKEISPITFSPEYQADGQRSETKAKQMIQIALKNGFNRFEWLHQNANNKSFLAEVWLTSIPYENTKAIHVVVLDLTEIKRKEKLLKLQKQEIEQTHKDITDSINYAKTIQDALLTNKELIDSYINDYFIYYKPKGQIGGDFYYFNKIGKYLIIAIADCTGHGVPGALITMLGITYLHEIVNKHDIDNPGTALNILRERFKKTFKSFGSNNSNGLDIALCAINTKTNILQYAGAYNPLILIRNNKLIEYKATKNPVGFYPREKKFENNIIQLQKDDRIYLYSDGFHDQFGDNDKKKFMSREFKNLLLDNHKLPMKIQKKNLITIFNEWKGTNEQTDDILVFGMKL